MKEENKQEGQGPFSNPVSAPSPNNLLVETLLKEMDSLKTQLTNTKQDYWMEIEAMKGNVTLLEREKQNLRSALYTMEIDFGERATRQRAEIDALLAENQAMKKRCMSMSTQGASQSSLLKYQLNSVIEEKLKEKLQGKAQVEHNRDHWERKFAVVGSRYKIDRLLYEEAMKKREKKEEAEMEEQRRKAELRESERKMPEMREQEMERDRAKKMKEEQEEAARRAREEDYQKQRDAEFAKEQARQATWKDATYAELYRCYTRDHRFISRRPWNNGIAFERFHDLMGEFEARTFLEQQPLMLENIPWPTLYPIFYHSISQSLVFGFRAENITWAEVEKFFSYVAMAYQVEYYNGLVERVHRIFHPDKWRSRRILDSVQDSDIRKSLESAGNIVAQAITPLWKKSKGRM
ncbi:hypothetical protein H2248_003413 [Termitomyces sp. 'cryptogamus']|nr:hypothetical protein H2248_003413 [Termitomyces sp. 'cryptogamus']